MAATTTATDHRNLRPPMMQPANELLRKMTIEETEWFRQAARQNAVV